MNTIEVTYVCSTAAKTVLRVFRWARSALRYGALRYVLVNTESTSGMETGMPRSTKLVTPCRVTPQGTMPSK